MQRLLLVLILTFSFQTLTKADDIKDFEIEGMSIADNLLEYFSNDEISQFSISFGPLHNAIEISSDDKNRADYYPLEKYDGLQISYKKNNNTFYEITSISGSKWYNDDIKNCLKKKNEIKPSIENFLESSIIAKNDATEKRKHWADKTGKSFTYGTTYYFENDNQIRLDCFDWSKEIGYWDHLRITVITSEHAKLINNDYGN